MAKKAKAKSDENESVSAAAPAGEAPRIDPLLLARIRGDLGDRQTITKIYEDIAHAFIEFLPEVFQTDTPFEFEIGYEGVETGFLDDLIADLGDTYALCDASLRGWCADYTLACSNTFVMILVESLLGAATDEIIEPEPRPLSKIELELAKMVFERISGVMRSVLSLNGNVEPVLSAPYNAGNRPPRPEGYLDPHAAVLNMKFKIGDIHPAFAIVVPQRTLLKTKVVSAKTGGGRTKKEWTDQLKAQVERSNIGIEARIKLQELTLNTLSRLQAGDIIPFNDRKDVRVNVRANGKDLYVGELGRTGAKYTVRVKDTFGTEEELLSHLMG
ncbi:FliM/FliN family flagellar motor switch protein [Rhizobium sp. L1K21]|uniref:FliM/FliN family flagellar motor switch protein n=1 Tax=Rhizobium sp. L1K21 TaxID=2954933 RepID=UPI002092F4D2|nr:FliM/FliN family flagellar motor switch protein [Rhizobium sp. L1K21]MCO6187133.1 FliM/FliN family flagellar motor switch protein [Rhizobium sp. L1K21]